MTSNEIRSSFLKYFEGHKHRIVSSSPLVPHEDPTLLFTNAGMNQFKDVFLGRERREYRRATTAQKCMRVSGKHNDLDNVGPSFSHHTFFEMLGNFSFGDYFKRDAIHFAWELLTEVWNLAPDRLVVSIFKGNGTIPRDEEAYDVWRDLVPIDRILELGADDNFWQMGETGPCGRCSEIYYVRGNGGPEIEIWNNVFMEFERDADGTLTGLPAPSIDTGMGLERIAAVLQGTGSNYDTDLFGPLLGHIATIAGRPPHAGSMSSADVSMRVVADHMRAMTFLIADGVIPSNEHRGYVLRKIMRRAMRHGRHLGLSDPFLHTLVAVLVRDLGAAYPELPAARETIERTVLAEERRFDAVLNDGLPRLEAELEKALAAPDRLLSGDVVFRLYETFGLPYDFIEDTAATQDLKVDGAGYQRALEAQRRKARAKSAFEERKVDEITFASAEAEGALQTAGDRFEGYDTTVVSGTPILAIFDERRRQVDELPEGHAGYVALERTPFYVEAGGQVSDSGVLRRDPDGATAIVQGMLRAGAGHPRLHQVQVRSGRLRARDLVTAEVDATARDATRRNHTATHLLHAALRQVLGTHVKQAGSLVAPDRLRFDFVHFQSLTRDELTEIERLVNEHVCHNSLVETDERSTSDAMEAGAMALFGEKYGDRVRVVSVPGCSLELCGGTHCHATGDIGLFSIVSEGGVAAGVRRIEAVTGYHALTKLQADRDALRRVLSALNAPPDRAVEAVERLQGEIKRLRGEVGQLRTDAAIGTAGGANRKTVRMGDVDVVLQKVPNLDKDALRKMTDSLREFDRRSVFVLATTHADRVGFTVSVPKDLTSRVHAGQVVKAIAPIVGGGGGGRPDFAEAGGKDPTRIDALLDEGARVLAQMLLPGSV